MRKTLIAIAAVGFFALIGGTFAAEAPQSGMPPTASSLFASSLAQNLSLALDENEKLAAQVRTLKAQVEDMKKNVADLEKQLAEVKKAAPEAKSEAPVVP